MSPLSLYIYILSISTLSYLFVAPPNSHYSWFFPLLVYLLLFTFQVSCQEEKGNWKGLLSVNSVKTRPNTHNIILFKVFEILQVSFNITIILSLSISSLFLLSFYLSVSLSLYLACFLSRSHWIHYSSLIASRDSFLLSALCISFFPLSIPLYLIQLINGLRGK